MTKVLDATEIGSCAGESWGEGLRSLVSIYSPEQLWNCRYLAIISRRDVFSTLP